MGMIDAKGVPATALVQGLLKAMMAKGIETFVLWQEGSRVAFASNRATAEALARNALTLQDGHIEAAAVALHASRLSPPKDQEAPAPENDTTGLCSIVVCAGHELAEGKGEPVKWDDLPEEIRVAHRLVVQAVVAAAVAHRAPPKDSRIIKPA